MHVLSLIILTMSLCLGVYGAVARQGSNIVHLDRRMTIMALLWGAMQLLVACTGYGIGTLLLRAEIAGMRSTFWPRVLAGVLLILCGIRMVMIGLKRKTFFEHRMEKIDMREDLVLSLRTGGMALTGGVVCGLLQYPIAAMIPASFAGAGICTVLGYLGGRAFGPANTDTADILGGVLLCFLAAALQM